MKHINGDIIELAKSGVFDVIAHGCNCQGNMGKGLAKQIKEQFPKVGKIDQKGEYPGTIYAVTYPNGLTIVNAYTQIYYGKANDQYKSLSVINNFACDVVDSQKNRYEFIRHCLRAINTFFAGKKLGLPLIGSGLAGGDWKLIEVIITQELFNCDTTIVHYK